MSSTQLLLLSALLIAWLLPLSSYLLLRGMRDHKAQIWFGGAWLYAIAATTFVLGPSLLGWAFGPLTMALTLLAALCFGEALRQELSPRPTPVAAYAGLSLLELGLLAALYHADLYPTWGRSVHLTLMAALDAWVMLMALQILKQRGGRALYLVVTVFGLLAVINLARACEFFLTGQFSELLSLRPMGNLGWLGNFLGVVMYCYGYWGFVMEKARAQETAAVEQALLALQGEQMAQERQRIAELTLTERNAMMEKVASMGKLAQAGALTAALTHEISQPLSSVLLNAQQALALTKEPDPGTTIPPLLERTVKETLRAAHTLSRIKDMFQASTPRIDTLCPAQVVRFTAAMMEQRLQEDGIALELELDGAPQVMLSPGGLEHVLLNLFHNALDAMQSTPRAQRRIRIRTLETRDGELPLCFEDSGPGVAPDEAESIFEMNFSSKAQHMGMGLWLARFIMERHGGRIWLDKGGATGAVFILTLPLAPHAEP